MGHKIVVWDPAGEYWEGSLVDDKVAAALVPRGVVLLPVQGDLLVRSGIGGFCKRAWGAGWPLNYIAPRMCCPLTIFIPAAIAADSPPRTLHWAIRLVPEVGHVAAAKEGARFTQGVIRIVADTSQAMARTSAIATQDPPHDGSKLGKLDEHGGWALMGCGRIHPQSDGYYGFGIYGTMPGVRVAWAALSLAG